MKKQNGRNKLMSLAGGCAPWPVQFYQRAVRASRYKCARWQAAMRCQRGPSKAAAALISAAAGPAAARRAIRSDVLTSPRRSLRAHFTL